MKKLMIAAAAVAIVGGAFAAGNTFEYKASVKYVDMNKKSVTIDHDRVNAYIKVVKTASITGYLVVDPNCPCVTPGDAPKHGFLIVENKAKKSGPKLFPANLYAKYWRDKVSAKTLPAEGYLFAGKGAIAAVATPEAAQDFGEDTTKMTYKLFGAFNMKDGDNFVESWLDAAGFGKAKFAEGEEEGCDIGDDGVCLTDLSGSVIGGLFLCRANSLGEAFLCMNWAKTTDVISGTWSIKNTSKVTALDALPEGIQAQKASEDTLKYLGGAGKKMKSGWTLKDVEEKFRQDWF